MKPIFSVGLLWDQPKSEFTVVVSSTNSSTRETFPSMSKALKRMEQLMKTAQKNLQQMIREKR